ncbi:MAG: MBL fold metallo-hydrolase [Bacteroidota bacterium]
MQKNSPHIEIYQSGYCTANVKYSEPQQPSHKIKFYATWALIRDQQMGNILFDTGYSNRFFEGTRSFPSRIYRWITPVSYNETESCKNLLSNIKIDHVIISHFHADHVGGLIDFPDATIWCTKKEFEVAVSRKKSNGVFKGILTNQIPDDLASRVKHPELEYGKTQFGPLNGWSFTNNIHFISLPGHTAGQIGLLIQNSNIGDILLNADASWSQKAVKEKIYPSKMVSLFIDSYSKLKVTIDKLHEFHQMYPEVKILPTHCIETAKLAINNDGI